MNILLLLEKGRSIITLLMIFFISLTLYNCEEKEDEIFLSITEDTVTVQNDESSQKITISASGKWSAISDQSWLTLLNSSGEGNGSVTFEISKNLELTERSANVTITADGVSPKIVKVNQGAGEPFVELDKVELLFSDPNSLTMTFEISSNKPWVISKTEEWVNVTPNQGEGNATIIVEVNENREITERTDTITITASDVEISPIIVVKQDGGEPFLELDKQELLFSDPDMLIKTFQITSNIPWTIAKTQEWFSVDAVSGDGDATITIEVQENFDISIREEALLISSMDFNISKNVLIKQNPRAIVVAGGNGMGNDLNQFNFPSTIDVDNQGNLYVTDQLNHRVVKWLPNSAEGVLVAGGVGQGTSLFQLNNPYGIFVAENGDLFISDNGNGRILRWVPETPSGVVVAGGNGSGSDLNQLVAPSSIFVNANNTVFITDGGNDRTVKWSEDAAFGEIVVSGGFPAGVFLDKDENIYIASNLDNNVTKWVPGATEGIVVAGGNGRGSALNQFEDISGIYVDDDNNVFVVDQVNNRVMKWGTGALTGVIVAGGNARGTNIDQLNSPSGITLDSEGNIFVCDQANNRIVKWLK